MSQIPRLQLALDTQNLSHALDVLQQTYQLIDIIEIGTLLCLSEGLNAVRTVRELYPAHTLVADIRIVRAGGKIAKMVFDAGADLVTVVAEAPVSTLEAVCTVAKDSKKEVQIELGETLGPDQPALWKELSVTQVIYHSNTEVSGTGQSRWPDKSLALLAELCHMGFQATATGGIKPETIAIFSGIPLSVIIAGRAIWASDSPEDSARAIREAIVQTYA